MLSSWRSPLIPLALAWVGYFSPWLWPTPAALRLSGYDLVEWLSLAQSVRDGTYPISRLDLLWPLVGIALLTALIERSIEPQSRKERESVIFYRLRALRAFAVRHWLSLTLALFAAYLILPGYPFVLTAADDPELRPQLIAGVVTGIAAVGAAVLAWLRPKWARWASVIIALLSLIAAGRAFAISRQPIADILAQPAPIGYGIVLALIGFAWLAVVCLTGIWRDGKMPSSEARV